VVAEEAT